MMLALVFWSFRVTGGSAVSLPTLTLYGIAGIVHVGMAVDANVLIFERMREEWKVGKQFLVQSVMQDIMHSAQLDANVTTLLTAIIFSGKGPIRGFAVTLSAVF